MQDRKYLIRGVDTPTRIPMALKDGDLVNVLWERSTPKVILDVVIKFGGSDETFGGGGIVEELFIHGEAGARDVYYRNDSQITKLDVRKLFPEDPTRVRWGVTDNAFVVLCEPSYTFWVFQLSRAKHAPAGAFKQRATLKQTVDLATKDITLLDFHLVSHIHSDTHIIEINPQSPSGFALGADHVFDVGGDFDGHLVQKVDIPQLVAGQANVLDGSVNDFIPNHRVIGSAFQTIRFQFISDFWLDGDGSKAKPYTVMVSLLTDYQVTGNDTFAGTSLSVQQTCTTTPEPGHDGFELTYVVAEGDWVGDLHTRAGYVIDVTNGVVVHSGTGALARTFDNSESGGASTSPSLVNLIDPDPPLACETLSPTTYIPGEDAPPEGDTGLTYDGTHTASVQSSYAPNLLDPTGSPFMTEDPLTETTTSGANPDGTYYSLSGQAKPNNPVFFDETPIPGQTSTAAVNSFRMVTMSILSFDPKDQTKTRIWAVLRHDSGSFHSILPEEYIWAVKVVILDGLFNVKTVLTDWRRQIYKHGTGVSGFAVGTVTLLGSNAKHVLWQEHVGSTPTGDPDIITGAQYVETRRTLLCDYAAASPTVKVVGADSPGSDTTEQDEFASHNFRVLGEEVDLFYEGKEAKPGRRFVEAWDFKTKKPTLDQTDPEYPKEDTRFKSASKLKTLPEEIVTTTDVAAAYHGIGSLGKRAE